MAAFANKPIFALTPVDIPRSAIAWKTDKKLNHGGSNPK
jgi:hypothetical protein